MKAAASVILAALVAQDPMCDHGSRGPSRPIDLREVERIHDEMRRAFDSLGAVRGDDFKLPSFDSGLPSCRARSVRRVRVEPLPPEMKPLYFAPAGHEAPGDALLVATQARSVADAALLADKELAARFGVRCSPSFVRLLTPSEIEITEGGAP
jgi:hypothetical protein